MVMVLHDDDKLVLGGLAVLAEVLDDDRDVVGAYGAQQVIDGSSRVDEPASAALNQRYSRTAENRGATLSIMAAALRQQFPNDGYLLRAEHVRGQRFATFEEVGDACDFAFTIALARANPGRRFHFVDRVTSQYRVHDAQISRRQRNHPMLSFPEGIPEDGLDGVARVALADAKDRIARDAISEFLAAGRRRGRSSCRGACGVTSSRSGRWPGWHSATSRGPRPGSIPAPIAPLRVGRRPLAIMSSIAVNVDRASERQRGDRARRPRVHRA